MKENLINSNNRWGNPRFVENRKKKNLISNNLKRQYMSSSILFLTHSIKLQMPYGIEVHFVEKSSFLWMPIQTKRKKSLLIFVYFFLSSREFINAYHKNQQIITKRNKKNSRKHEYKWFAFVYFYDCITNITNSICFSFYYFRCWYCCCLWFRRTVHSPLFKHKTLLLNLSTIKLY